MLQSTSNDSKININQEITKAFQNVNYSQWERQTTKQATKQDIKKPGIYIFLI
jgi:hypothetical protein